MDVRILGESDATAWWQLRWRALESEPFAFGRAVEEHEATGIDEIVLRFRNASSVNFTLGAFNGDHLIGMATFVRETCVKEKHKARIYGVYVAPEERRNGVGRQLLSTLLKRAREDASLEQILLAVTTCQEAAGRLYRHFGFETYGTEPRALKVGTHYLDENYMMLRLQ